MKPMQEHLIQYYRNFVKFGSCRFVPLISRTFKELCDFEITWLRNEEPGALIQGGDLDNRLKTLFDALRIPQTEEEAAGMTQEMCFCLLEDDVLIRNIRIKTGRLLEQMAKDTDIHLTIEATVVSAEE